MRPTARQLPAERQQVPFNPKTAEDDATEVEEVLDAGA